MSKPLECRAIRRGRSWVVHIPEHGVYGHGRTLPAVSASTAQGLELVGVTAQITVTPTTPELEKLRAAEDAYMSALSEAVTALALRRTTLRDIAAATRTPIARVRLLLTENTKDAHSLPPREEPGR